MNLEKKPFKYEFAWVNALDVLTQFTISRVLITKWVKMTGQNIHN